jgi:hypothetical protein
LRIRLEFFVVYSVNPRVLTLSVWVGGSDGETERKLDAVTQPGASPTRLRKLPFLASVVNNDARNASMFRGVGRDHLV